MSITQLVSMIPDWLEVTAGRDVSVGLSREEALRRAGLLRGLLRDDKFEPKDVALDEDLKGVFHALVALVTNLEPLEDSARAEETNRVYQFLLAVNWEGDTLDEKRSLLTDCAMSGLRALRLDFESLTRLRLALPNHELSAVTRPLPARVGKLLLRCARLRDQVTRAPGPTAVQSTRLYRRLAAIRRHHAFFDEINFLLGEASIIAGMAYRVQGNREEAALWLCRAEESYGLTLLPVPGLLEITFQRLAIECDRQRFSGALQVAPGLASRCEEAGMWRYALNFRLIVANCLKELGRRREALAAFEALRADPRLESVSSIKAAVLVRLCNLLSEEGRHEEACDLRKEASIFVGQAKEPMFAADLETVIAEALRDQSRFEEAISAYRAGINSYHQLGMVTFVAYVRVLLADTLVHCGRPHEAAQEILQALPTIEEQKMLSEGLAAVALLRESVKRCKADPKALRELREHLQRQH